VNVSTKSTTSPSGPRLPVLPASLASRLESDPASTYKPTADAGGPSRDGTGADDSTGSSPALRSPASNAIKHPMQPLHVLLGGDICGHDGCRAGGQRISAGGYCRKAHCEHGTALDASSSSDHQRREDLAGRRPAPTGAASTNWQERRLEPLALEPASQRRQYPERRCAAQGRHHLSPSEKPRPARIPSG
jgi:hypothetical protein